MSFSTSAVTAATGPAWAHGLAAPAGLPSAQKIPAQPGAADVKKAAGQFEAIILRQLLGPSIEPMMSGGSGAGGSGGGVYGYMLTDVLCSSLGASGGLGLGRMLEKQLAPPAPAAGQPSDDDSSTSPSL